MKDYIQFEILRTPMEEETSNFKRSITIAAQDIVALEERSFRSVENMKIQIHTSDGKSVLVEESREEILDLISISCGRILTTREMLEEHKDWVKRKLEEKAKKKPDECDDSKLVEIADINIKIESIDIVVVIRDLNQDSIYAGAGKSSEEALKKAIAKMNDHEKKYDKPISIPDASKNNSGTLHGEELAEYLLKSTMSCEEIDSKIKESETLGIIMTIDYMFENMVDTVSIVSVIKSVELSLSEVEKHSENMFDCLERWKKHRNWDSIKKALIDNEK